MDPKTIPATLVSILIMALLIVALIPELRTAVTGATHITGVSATILGYLGMVIVAGATITIVLVLIGKSKKSATIYKLKLIALSKRATMTINSAIVIIVALVISFLVGVAFLDELANQIHEAVKTGGPLNDTLEGMLLNNWVVIIVAGMLIGTLGLFMASGGGKRFRSRFKR